MGYIGEEGEWEEYSKGEGEGENNVDDDVDYHMLAIHHQQPHRQAGRHVKRLTGKDEEPKEEGRKNGIGRASDSTPNGVICYPEEIEQRSDGVVVKMVDDDVVEVDGDGDGGGGDRGGE
ncbi:hypothetical protein AOL_s00083g199 [Orbilia oligospora ATCC 24927]|uniref:Uncharacterized protein n=1 Tax=Arthrobotrys oligospora (strain ATCC 24927 / CBS 115.81 / DSM 1491) TaxID=756982 RepID=G1XGR8_ARTOA|nr:hypothetical protein AOL_s00083g199 [Orbilia oligospora ATCC 24927]EGX47691.1 hypothetical protein AOL_s00083g199 [Orbilia oligospora ATCC 24927]